jgi:hypothetical protein
MSEQLRGYMTTTTTQSQLHSATYCHNKISDIINMILEKPMLMNAGIERIEIVPKYAKKSTAAFERSEKCAETGPKVTVGSQALAPPPFSPTSIVTEQGIRITFGPKGNPAFSVGPL